MVCVGRCFERGSKEISLNRDLNKRGIKTNSSKYLGKILGRETKNPSQEGEELCPWKEQGHPCGAAHTGVTTLLAAPLGPSITQLHQKRNQLVLLNIQLELVRRTHPSPPLTLCYASICRECPQLVSPTRLESSEEASSSPAILMPLSDCSAPPVFAACSSHCCQFYNNSELSANLFIRHFVSWPLSELPIKCKSG